MSEDAPNGYGVWRFTRIGNVIFCFLIVGVITLVVWHQVTYPKHVTAEGNSVERLVELVPSFAPLQLESCRYELISIIPSPFQLVPGPDDVTYAIEGVAVLLPESDASVHDIIGEWSVMKSPEGRLELAISGSFWDGGILWTGTISVPRSDARRLEFVLSGGDE